MKLRMGWILVLAVLLVTLVPASALAIRHKAPKAGDSTATATAPAAQQAPAKAEKAPKAPRAPKAPAGPVDINNATQKDLEALPGVGPATATKIIAGRPYSSVADLSKAGVPARTIEKITSMVTVGYAARTPAPAAAPAAPARTYKSPSYPVSQAAGQAKGATGAARGAAQTVAQSPPRAGMVWVNLDSKVFHREGDRWYGKTKNGKFMTEQEAISYGARESKTGGAASK
jgi:DNA uptake protein ComE-like DNA-binding protein